MGAISATIRLSSRDAAWATRRSQIEEGVKDERRADPERRQQSPKLLHDTDFLKPKTVPRETLNGAKHGRDHCHFAG
jgi:hypothetical protein